MNVTDNVQMPQSGGLRAPRHSVSRKAIGYWIVRALPLWVIVIGGQVLFLVLNPGGASDWLPITLAVSAVIGMIHVVVMPLWRYRVHRWEITSDAVYTQSGWFNQEWRLAPISRIQTVDAERGPLEQLFGLSKVTVTTASAAGPVHIIGLDADTAGAVVEELARASQATKGDAT